MKFNFFSRSAIIEHTDQVIYLEENDVATVNEGSLNIHQATRSLNESTRREITTLKMAIEQIMKGSRELGAVPKKKKTQNVIEFCPLISVLTIFICLITESLMNINNYDM